MSSILNESQQPDEMKGDQSMDRPESPRHQQIFDHLLQSDHEMEHTVDNEFNRMPVLKVERMSFLSKLNLLGLISLSDIVL